MYMCVSVAKGCVLACELITYEKKPLTFTVPPAGATPPGVAGLACLVAGLVY